MADVFERIRTTDVIRDSLPKLLNRDLTALTLSSGTSFPTDVSEDMVGRIVNRTDLQALYRLKSTNPVQWEVILDYSSPIPNGTTIAATYQPLNSNLTALSALSGSANQVPYFVNANTMSTFPITDFGKNVLNCANSTALRTLYGLGALATKDAVGTADIQDSCVTEAKLAFTPIKSGEGFITGDVKESPTEIIEEGWINCSGTIGDASSEADYANANAENLFKALWTNQNLSVLPNKGSSAQNDWDAHKKLVLPEISGLFILNTYVRIKL